MPRKSGPWWRSGRKMWYVQIHGRQLALGITDPNDRDAATAEVQRLLAEGVPAKVVADPRAHAASLARALIDTLATLPGFANRE